MKLYVSGVDEEFMELLKYFSIVENVENSDQVLILPGGLGTFADLFLAIRLKKDVIVYNKDMFYTSMIKNLYEAHEKDYIEGAPSTYIHIESEIKEILKKLEER